MIDLYDGGERQVKQKCSQDSVGFRPAFCDALASLAGTAVHFHHSLPLWDDYYSFCTALLILP